MRTCNECTECCLEAFVQFRDFKKLQGKECPYQYKKGCLLIESPERPKVCHDYYCSWMRGAGNDKDRPDKSGIIISINNLNGGVFIFARERKENSVKTTGKNILTQVITQANIPAIVTDFSTPLGQDFGDYCIIKENLLKNTNKMRGDLIEYFDNEKQIGIYNLIAN